MAKLFGVGITLFSFSVLWYLTMRPNLDYFKIYKEVLNGLFCFEYKIITVKAGLQFQNRPFLLNKCFQARWDAKQT